MPAAPHAAIHIDTTTSPPTAQVTAIVCAYNQEASVGEAALSILRQTILPAELILSDDRSPDTTYEVLLKIAKEYTGPTKIRVRQNATNLRLAGHLNAAVAEATHDWILLQAGDDISFPHRLQTFLQHQAQAPATLLLFSDTLQMTWDGIPTNTPLGVLPWPIKPEPHPITHGIGASQMWHKHLFSWFGPLPDYVTAEDLILPFRALLFHPPVFTPELLLLWRMRKPEILSREDYAYLIEFRSRSYAYTSARAQLEDLGKFLRAFPQTDPVYAQLEKNLHAMADQGKYMFEIGTCTYRTRTGSWIQTAKDGLWLAIRYGLRKNVRDFLIVNVLLAPATLEDKIGRSTARSIATACALLAAVAAFIALQLSSLPLGLLAAACMALIAYPVGRLIIRTAIRLCTPRPKCS